jgi:hypothetical protein
VQNIRQLEAALHRKWQQLSQQDIRRLTGGMRRRVEAVIQARGGCQEVTEPAYDGLTCPNYAIWDSNPGSWLVKEQRSRLRFGGRRLLLLNDEAWRCHPYTQA